MRLFLTNWLPEQELPVFVTNLAVAGLAQRGRGCSVRLSEEESSEGETREET